MARLISYRVLNITLILIAPVFHCPYDAMGKSGAMISSQTAMRVLSRLAAASSQSMCSIFVVIIPLSIHVFRAVDLYVPHIAQIFI